VLLAYRNIFGPKRAIRKRVYKEGARAEWRTAAYPGWSCGVGAEVVRAAVAGSGYSKRVVFRGHGTALLTTRFLEATEGSVVDGKASR
jgi:hypothetical protein